MKSAKKSVAKAAVARKKAAAKKKAAVARKAVARPKVAAKKKTGVPRKAAARPKVAAVAMAQDDAKVAPLHPDLREEYTIEAQNFGPIAEAKLTLKPLTVLIGPSNTGKTYMAMLACMMLRNQVQFSHSVARGMRFFLRPDGENQNIHDIAAGIVTIIDAGGGVFSASKLPPELGKRMLRRVEKTYGNKWKSFPDELKDCCGAESAADLVAGLAPRNLSTYKFTALAGERLAAKADISISSKGVDSGQFKLPDISVPTSIPPGLKVKWIDEIRRIADGQSKLPSDGQMFEVQRALSRTFRASFQPDWEAPSVHFFPASRGGLMQARNAITIAMLKTVGRGGLESIPSIPALPLLSAEFLSGMVELTTQFHRNLSTPFVRSRRDIQAQAVAEKIERDLLGGKVTVENKNGGVFSGLHDPRVVFKPDGVSNALTLAQSSSMVEEIAPLVLYLKKKINYGDTLFIEEPEVHLHPVAQTKMSEILAAMVRAGIRVVITTHSDWLLDSIANLVRQGETNSIDGDLPLKEDEVGVYWFTPGKSGKGSKAILQSFDNDNGYLPKDVRSESTNLYNKTVPLQIKLDKMRDK